MQRIGEAVCRTANKVALDMAYAVGTTDQAISKNRIRDAFVATARMLLELRQSDFSEMYEKYSLIFSRSSEQFSSGSSAWVTFLDRQSDVLHRAYLHEKTIAIVGDELCAWNGQPLDSDIFCTHLDRLEYMVNCDAEKLVHQWHVDSTKSLAERKSTFTSILSGLAVVIANITDATTDRETDPFHVSAAVVFGATLVVNGTRKMCHDCDDQR